MKRMIAAGVVLLASLLTVGTVLASGGGVKLCIPENHNLAILTPNAKLQCTSVASSHYTLKEIGAEGKEGATGARGPTGPQGPAGLESTRFCTPNLCIDADPSSGGSGGWGWDEATNSAVTDLTIGHTAPFVVTVVQDGEEYAAGSITLAWNPADFEGPTAGSDNSASCTTASTGNALSCAYTDLSHQYKSVEFNFKPLVDSPDAQVEVTVVVNGEQASATFPVAVTG